MWAKTDWEIDLDKAIDEAIAEVSQALRLNWLIDSDKAHGLQGKMLYLSGPDQVHVGLPADVRDRLIDSIVKHCISKDVWEGMAKAWAGQAIDETLRTAAGPLEQVEGDVLPALGSRVWIRHGRDADAHACIVVGYYAWRALSQQKYSHRIFVRVVYEGTTTQNSRAISECWATKEEALAQVWEAAQ